MITWYNYPYYKDHYERLGFTPLKRPMWRVEFPANESDPDHYKRIQGVIKKRYQLRVLNFEKRTKDIMPWADRMFELFQKTYVKLWHLLSLCPKARLNFSRRKYLRFINPEYIKFVLDKDDQLGGFRYCNAIIIQRL